MRFYKDFIDVLKKEPTNIYSDEKNHPFVASLYEALAVAGVSSVLFEEWQVDVKTGFKVNNAFALAIPDLLDSNCPPDPHQLLTDPRCIIEAINNLSHVARVNSENQVTMIDNQNLIINKLNKIENTMAEQMADIQAELKSLQDTFMPNTKKKKADGCEASIIPWSATMKLIGKSTISPLSLFEMWFTKDMRGGYELENNRQVNDRKNSINKK
jgi:hypothetical protein